MNSAERNARMRHGSKDSDKGQFPLCGIKLGPASSTPKTFSGVPRRGLDLLSKKAHIPSSAELRYRGSDGSLQTLSRKDAERWQREAHHGKSAAQYNLGLMYFKGAGVDQNEKEAVKWFRKSAATGSVGGQGFLGIMYENGFGVESDYGESLRWYRKSAEQGNFEAQYHLGLMCKRGTGVDASKDEAVRWFRRAAENGCLPALGSLKKIQLAE